MALTIDPANKRFILDTTAVTAKSLYAAWVDWMALSDNAKYLPAFRTAGGDDLGGGLSIPPYYFLLNGWRVRPMEATQTLVIDGNLFVDGGGDPVVPTLGSFNVLVKSVVPVQAQGISTSGGGSGASAADVWAYASRSLTSSLDATAAEIAIAVRAAVADELAQLTKVAKIHGVGVPLVVTPTSRTAGDVSQTISTVGSTTTVSAA